MFDNIYVILSCSAKLLLLTSSTEEEAQSKT